MTDDELVEAHLGGDRDAFNELMSRHCDRVYALACRMMGQREDAKDATQEVFLQLLRKLDRYERRAAFKTWLYRVASNVCYDMLRRRGRQPALSSTDDDLPFVDAAAVEHFSAAEARPDVEKALARLPDEFRIVVVLHDVEQLRYSDIAEILDVPIGTVKSRLSRGRHELAVALRNLLTGEERPK